MEKVNLAQKFSLFQEHWSPKIVGELNDFHVKLVKVQGEFVWHHHETEDELFLIVKGRLRRQCVKSCVKSRELVHPSFRAAAAPAAWLAAGT